MRSFANRLRSPRAPVPARADSSRRQAPEEPHREHFVAPPDDAREQEADRLADDVMRNGHPVRSVPPLGEGSAHLSNHGPAAHTASEATSLDPEDRRFFESRFQRGFADVRIFADREAGASARHFGARAYTLGNTITFANGEYRPRTQTGRQLLAHELSHVLQQRSRTGPGPGVIQRQPVKEAEKPATKQAPQKPKSLKDMGVDVVDPVSGKTAGIIDIVLQRNKRLAPYIGDRLKKGFRIAEKGRFVRELNDGNFENSYRAAYGLGSSSSVPAHIMGFLDSTKSIIHLRPDAKFGTAMHEAVHRLASPSLYSGRLPLAAKVSKDLAEVLKEGVTAYFTDLILSDEGLSGHVDSYSKLKKKAAKLVAALGSDGFDLIAKFNFQSAGIVEIGEKLGLSRNKYIALKGGAVTEVLKRMDAVL
jgi:hypothetical protein